MLLAFLCRAEANLTAGEWPVFSPEPSPPTPFPGIHRFSQPSIHLTHAAARPSSRRSNPGLALYRHTPKQPTAQRDGRSHVRLSVLLSRTTRRLGVPSPQPASAIPFHAPIRRVYRPLQHHSDTLIGTDSAAQASSSRIPLDRR